MKVRRRSLLATRLGRLVLWGVPLVLLVYGPAQTRPLDSHAQEAGAQESHDGPSVTNEWCPVLTDERVDPEISTEYEGGRVFFCCKKCLKKFQADPAAYALRLPASLLPTGVATSPQGPEQDDHAVDHADEGATHAQEHDGSASGTHQEHDHASHGDEHAHGLRGWIEWVGRLHPMLVHFPIALLLLAALAELLASRSGDQRFDFAARFSLWAGTIGALAAAPLGWADALGMADEYTGASATLLLYHRWVGTATAAVALVALVQCERFHRSGRTAHRRSYRAALVTAAALVIVAGHLGASLIFGWDYLSK